MEPFQLCGIGDGNHCLGEVTDRVVARRNGAFAVADVVDRDDEVLALQRFDLRSPHPMVAAERMGQYQRRPPRTAGFKLSNSRAGRSRREGGQGDRSKTETTNACAAERRSSATTSAEGSTPSAHNGAAAASTAAPAV